ncbi:GAF domain-containing protein [Alkalitalea saponilacus]|uniref:GAF domain-containing protein n=1 Tax=Alkalitalea saponilacus TaxID=889453 RepID=A0A1T5HKW1_9BACT|nr:GAF domain-containing protein [Alkalitalea saponilacus]ASB47790.1 histidine kinase [Alkalitalea saponilacus]SKC21269.1 GAF domain-containing protein [Alkalitalea saponilacus]
MSTDKSKAGRYDRVYDQIKELVLPVNNPVSRMSTIAALLHHKMKGYFWTGFYFLDEGELIVGPYQGPIACLKLKKNMGVCWAGINSGESVVVDDVHQFPGHIACSSQSNSEIVVPVRNSHNKVVAVLDVDSREFAMFDETDRIHLEKIVALIYM